MSTTKEKSKTSKKATKAEKTKTETKAKVEAPVEPKVKAVDPEVTEMAKKLNISEEEAKQAIKFEKKLKAAEANAIAKYGKGSGYTVNGVVEERNIVAGSAKFIPNASGNGGKIVVTIKCVDTGEEREVATSDLQNVARSVEAQKAFLANRRKAKRTTLSAAKSAELVNALRDA